MPADHLLNTVLELYQSVHDGPKTDQIIGSTVNLLTTLSNPLNISVLTSQLLTAPAIWHRRDGIATSFRIISIYHTAASKIRQGDRDTLLPGGRSLGRLGCDAWARAVAKGADDRSSRWQHLLVLAGVLLGMDSHDGSRTLSGGLRNTLEEAVVKAANLALTRPMQDGPVAAASISVALGFALPHISEAHLRSINSDLLLPNAVWTMTGEEGFHGGHVLSTINSGITRSPEQPQLMHWSSTSPSFRLLQQLDSKPLVAGMGAVAKLIMHAMHHATDARAVLQAQDALLEFSREILDKWQACTLSQVEVKTEGQGFTPETLHTTYPALWEHFKKILYTVTAALQALMARCLLDPRLRNDEAAPVVASKTLLILRNLYFISSRDGNGSFQSYSFANLTAIDILSRYPHTTIALLSEIRPDAAGVVPAHPVHRTLDLFYLGLAEHLPVNIPAAACEALIVQPATVYLSTVPATHLARELFESAHSAVLSVLSCPQNSPLATSLVPFYIDKLFSSFPSHISPRQFRVAFKTVMRIVSPPFPVSATNPELSEVILEMLRFRAVGADGALLPPPVDAAGGEPPVSEQSALVLALVDALPFLPLPLMEEWLAITAETVGLVADPGLRLNVRKRFWEVLESGELDVGRASLAVSWWYSQGGRELVAGTATSAAAPEPYVMSGAIVEEKKEDVARL